MYLSKKVFGIVALTAVFSFAHSGIAMGGSDGLHQVNARTFGQWKGAVGLGGSVSADAWAFSRGGNYEMDGQNYAILDHAATIDMNLFFGFGVLDFLDLSFSIPIYYDHAQDGMGGASNMWTTSRGDLDIGMKVRAPFDTNRVWSVALLLDVFAPTGETQAGVRPRHAWYLNATGNTQPFSAYAWAIASGLAFTLDLEKIGVPLRWNTSASVVFPFKSGEATTLVYSTGLNATPLSFVDAFIEFSGEMRLQSIEDYEFDPLDDPMLLTPGLRFHLTQDIDLAMGLDVAVRTLKNLSFKMDKEMKGADILVQYSGERNHNGSYYYTPTPLWAGSAVLTVRFGGAGKAPKCEVPQGLPSDSARASMRDTVVIHKIDTIYSIDTTNRIPPAPVRYDFDKDGVVDSLDKCPNTPDGYTVDEKGCPLDFDMDGVPDVLDKCPNSRGDVEVNLDGCAKDYDKDGVPDVKDRCPNTLEGVAIDSVGCPLDKKEDLDELKKGIQFKNNSAKLTKASFATLDDIARLMQKYPKANLEVQGHTDSKGTDEFNMKLSERRAQTVVKYLVKKGVEPARLRAVGYGRTRPIANNKKKGGREKNRRVEMIPF